MSDRSGGPADGAVAQTRPRSPGDDSLMVEIPAKRARGQLRRKAQPLPGTLMVPIAARARTSSTAGRPPAAAASGRKKPGNRAQRIPGLTREEVVEYHRRKPDISLAGFKKEVAARKLLAATAGGDAAAAAADDAAMEDGGTQITESGAEDRTTVADHRQRLQREIPPPGKHQGISASSISRVSLRLHHCPHTNAAVTHGR